VVDIGWPWWRERHKVKVRGRGNPILVCQPGKVVTKLQLFPCHQLFITNLLFSYLEAASCVVHVFSLTLFLRY
jgi:hypothetical protein